MEGYGPPFPNRSNIMDRRTSRLYFKKAIKEVDQFKDEYDDNLIEKDKWYLVFLSNDVDGNNAYNAYLGFNEEYMKQQYQYEPWAIISLDMFSSDDDESNSIFFIEIPTDFAFMYVDDEFETFIRKTLSSFEKYIKDSTS